MFKLQLVNQRERYIKPNSIPSCRACFIPLGALLSIPPRPLSPSGTFRSRYL